METGHLSRTECCNRATYNDEEHYQTFSYSAVSCNRTHRRWTRYGLHHNEGHEEKDWRVVHISCELRDVSSLLIHELFLSLGPFNFKKDEWRDAPELILTKFWNLQNIIGTATETRSEFLLESECPHADMRVYVGGWGDDLRRMNCIGTWREACSHVFHCQRSLKVCCVIWIFGNHSLIDPLSPTLWY